MNQATSPQVIRTCVKHRDTCMLRIAAAVPCFSRSCLAPAGGQHTVNETWMRVCDVAWHLLHNACAVLGVLISSTRSAGTECRGSVRGDRCVVPDRCVVLLLKSRQCASGRACLRLLYV